MKKRIESIEAMRKHFKDEWLLIMIDKMDTATTTPINGHLLAHSSNRDEIYDQSSRHKGLTYITYSSHHAKKGLAYAF